MKLHLLLLSAFILILTGCEIAVSEKLNDDLVIGVWGGGEGKQVEDLANRYSEEFGIAVEVEVINADAYQDHLSTIILSKSPRWDIALARSEWIGPWIDYKGVIPIGKADPLTPDNELINTEKYSVPVAKDVPILWYRKDMLARANIHPPGTWEELFITAKKLTRPPDFYGLGMANDQYSMGQDYLQIFIGFGGMIDQERREILFESDQGISALEYYIQLRQEGTLAPITEENADPVKLLQNNQTAMAILWTSQAEVLLDCENSPSLCSDGASLLVGVELPVIDMKSQAHYLRRSTELIIPPGSDSIQDANGFLAWLESDNGQLQLRETADLSTPIRSLVDRFYGHGIDLDSFRFTDNFYDQVSQTISDAVNGQLSYSDAMVILSDSMKDDVNRTSLRP